MRIEGQEFSHPCAKGRAHGWGTQLLPRLKIETRGTHGEADPSLRLPHRRKASAGPQACSAQDDTLLWDGIGGTTEVVPCYKARSNRRSFGSSFGLAQDDKSKRWDLERGGWRWELRSI
jgi:hypothetical protein